MPINRTDFALVKRSGFTTPRLFFLSPLKLQARKENTTSDKSSSYHLSYAFTVGVLIVEMGQGGCHAQQIEKNYSPSKRIKRRSNFVRLLKNFFHYEGTIFC